MKSTKHFWHGLLLSLLCLALAPLAAGADVPFRNHRYDAFRVLKVQSDNIVFVGNSITNMHEWWEAFGSDHKILNRGVSGALSDECLANIEAVLVGHPKAIFLMIGTNDLGTYIGQPLIPYENFKKIVQTVRRESPETKLYIESVLPVAATNSRTAASITELNQLMKDYVEDIENVTYLDIYSQLTATNSTAINGSYSLDGLHLLCTGYNKWCEYIKEYVGDDHVYSDGMTYEQGSWGGSHSMRASYFSAYPVYEDDILFFGDEMVHGGEWHELLNCDKLKSRSTGWGFAGADIAGISGFVDISLNPNYGADGGHKAPKKVLVSVGASNCNSSSFVLSTATSAYQTMVQKIVSYAPNAKIALLSVLPSTTASYNTNVTNFNAWLKTYCEENGYTFIDANAAVAGNVAKYMNSTNYLYGLGYIKVAQAIQPFLAEEGATVMSEEEAEAQVEMLSARSTLLTAVTALQSMEPGTGVGQYDEAAYATATAALDEAIALTMKEDATTDEILAAAETLSAAAETLKPHINLPVAYTDETPNFYTLSSVRDNCYVSTATTTGGLTSVADNDYATSQWKFVGRGDGTYDIVNRGTGTYISPTATYNTSLTMVESQPTNGWTISYGNTAGTYIFSCGTVQMNQTSLSGKPVYNWSTGQSGQDRDDTGCQFRLALVEDPVVTVCDIAEELIAYTGIGYPAADAASRTALRNAIDECVAAGNTAEAEAVVQTAMAAFRTEATEIETFQDGHAYVIINKQYGGVEWLLQMGDDATGLHTASVPEDAAYPQEAIFVAHQLESGKFALVSTNNKFLAYRGTAGKTDGGFGSNLGYFYPYDATDARCDWSIYHPTVANKQSLAGDVTDDDFFGLVCLSCTRNNANKTQAGLIVAVAGTFDQAGTTIFYNGSYSNCYQVVEVPYYNAVALTAAAQGETQGAMGTVYLPFAVEIPEGITASTAVYADRSLIAVPVEGGVVPAETAVILQADEPQEVFLSPSISVGDLSQENSLCGTLAEEEATPDGTYAYDTTAGVAGFAPYKKATLVPATAYFVAADTEVGIYYLDSTTGEALADYATNWDGQNSAHASRYTTGVTLTNASGTVQESSTLQTGTGQPIVWDMTDTDVFEAAPSESITVGVKFVGTWMNAYTYVDEDRDGFNVETNDADHTFSGDLKSFSFYAYSTSDDTSGYNSDGTLVTGASRNSWTMPAFQAPAAEGTYRMRVKVDWSSVDPKGQLDNLFGGNTQTFGGIIYDALLHIDTANGIATANAQRTDSALYDLQGRRIQRPTHGVYIQAGQKRIVK